MRFTLPMSIAVCALCLVINSAIHVSRIGEDGRPVCTQPPVTQPEIDAALADRQERLRAERFASPPCLAAAPPAVTQRVTLLDPDFSGVYAD
jgi:hypothetical protein